MPPLVMLLLLYCGMSSVNQHVGGLCQVQTGGRTVTVAYMEQNIDIQPIPNLREPSGLIPGLPDFKIGGAW